MIFMLGLQGRFNGLHDSSLCPFIPQTFQNTISAELSEALAALAEVLLFSFLCPVMVSMLFVLIVALVVVPLVSLLFPR